MKPLSVLCTCSWERDLGRLAVSVGQPVARMQGHDELPGLAPAAAQDPVPDDGQRQ